MIKFEVTSIQNELKAFNVRLNVLTFLLHYMFDNQKTYFNIYKILSVYFKNYGANFNCYEELL